MPTDLIIKRCVGRITCDTCGKIENEYFSDFREGDSCGEGVYVKRADDNEDIAIKRYKTYEKSTEPVIEYYKRLNLLKVIDGERPIDQINNEISDIINLI